MNAKIGEKLNKLKGTKIFESMKNSSKRSNMNIALISGIVLSIFLCIFFVNNYIDGVKLSDDVYILKDSNIIVYIFGSLILSLVVTVLLLFILVNKKLIKDAKTKLVDENNIEYSPDVTGHDPSEQLIKPKNRKSIYIKREWFEKPYINAVLNSITKNNISKALSIVFEHETQLTLTDYIKLATGSWLKLRYEGNDATKAVKSYIISSSAMGTVFFTGLILSGNVINNNLLSMNHEKFDPKQIIKRYYTLTHESKFTEAYEYINKENVKAKLDEYQHQNMMSKLDLYQKFLTNPYDFKYQSNFLSQFSELKDKKSFLKKNVKLFDNLYNRSVEESIDTKLIDNIINNSNDADILAEVVGGEEKYGYKIQEKMKEIAFQKILSSIINDALTESLKAGSLNAPKTSLFTHLIGMNKYLVFTDDVINLEDIISNNEDVTVYVKSLIRQTGLDANLNLYMQEYESEFISCYMQDFKGQKCEKYDL